MTPDTMTLRLAGGAQGFNWLPVFVADDQGIFARHGLEIEYLRLGSVSKATDAVRDGSADLAITPPEGAITDALQGGGLRLIASNAERLPMSMVARPGIDDLGGLRGARIGTSSLTEGTAIYTQLMLERAGLRYPGDYEFVLAGVHTTRWDALQAGEIDAAPQPAPWTFVAERAGYRLLGEVADVLPEIVFAGIIGHVDGLAANAEAIRRLLAALAEAHEMVNDAANDAVTLPVYQRITTPDEPELAARALVYTRDLGMWPAGLAVSPTALATTIDVMISAGLIDESQRDLALGVLDLRFANVAHARAVKGDA